MRIDNKMQTSTALMLSLVMVLTLSAWSCPPKSASTWLNLANKLLPVAEQQAQAIIAIADPADAALAAQVSKGVSATLKAVTDAITAYTANPTASTLQNVAAAFDKASADLPAVLSNIQFSNVNVGLAIEAAVTAVSVGLDLIAAELPVATKAKTKMKAGLAPHVAATPEALRAAWNANVCDANPSVKTCPRM